MLSCNWGCWTRQCGQHSLWVSGLVLFVLLLVGACLGRMALGAVKPNLRITIDLVSKTVAFGLPIHNGLRVPPIAAGEPQLVVATDGEADAADAISAILLTYVVQRRLPLAALLAIALVALTRWARDRKSNAHWLRNPVPVPSVGALRVCLTWVHLSSSGFLTMSPVRLDVGQSPRMLALGVGLVTQLGANDAIHMAAAALNGVSCGSLADADKRGRPNPTAMKIALVLFALVPLSFCPFHVFRPPFGAVRCSCLRSVHSLAQCPGIPQLNQDPFRTPMDSDLCPRSSCQFISPCPWDN